MASMKVELKHCCPSRSLLEGYQQVDSMDDGFGENRESEEFEEERGGITANM